LFLICIKDSIKGLNEGKAGNKSGSWKNYGVFELGT